MRRTWTHEELILAFNLYCKTPFGKIHIKNQDIVELAELLNRTPSAVSWKLANFARLDPALKKRQIAGATHGSKAEELVWEEFNGNWEKLFIESESLFTKLRNMTIENPIGGIGENQLNEGQESVGSVRIRLKQHYFRQMVLASYASRCCITGLAIPDLLIASHIIPWVVDTKNRLNPRNGLCLNALHDKAFDRGLLTITIDYRVKISSRVKTGNDTNSSLLLRYDNKEINLPDKFLPENEFLAYHNEYIFME